MTAAARQPDRRRGMRWRAGLGAAVVLPLACSRTGGEVPPPTGAAPAPAQWVHGRLRQLPPWGDDYRRWRDPIAGGWTSEAWARRIEKDLPGRISAALAADGHGLEEILSEDFAGATALWPASLETVFDDGDLSVRRGRALDPGLHPRAELADLVRAWKASLREVTDLRVDVAIDGLDLHGGDRFETRIRLRVSGAAGPGSLQQNLRWKAEWAAPAKTEPPGSGARSAPRLVRQALESCEEVRARVRPFAELTRAVLSPCEGFDEEILRGSEDYHLHQDRLSGQPFLGMHGLAVGDVDGDGLEDLYLPQPGGQPNRLLLHQPDGTLRDAARAAGLDILDNCGPALILDLDNDGDEDVAVAAGPHILIGWNDGKGHFTEHTVLEGPDLPEITSLSAADPDGDGDLDLYACRYVQGGIAHGVPTPYWNADNGARNLYWRNEGGHRFVEAAKEVGLDVHANRFSLALIWEDFDEDGDVDLYVVNDFGKNCLYRNDGGKFTDVAEPNGVDDPAAGMGATCADVDRDGHVDLFVTNMDSPAGSRIAAQPQFMREHSEDRPHYVRHARGNTLLLNDGHGTFRDATEEAGVAPGGWAWGGMFFDLQNDGWPDLYVPNGFETNRDEDDLCGFFWRCVIARSPAAPPAPQDYVDAWDAIQHLTLFEGCSWNGRERNYAYLNLGGARFAEVSSALGVDFIDDARLVAPMDWDDDGRVDLWIRNRTGPRLRFLRNVDPSAGHWIALDLVGTTCNRDAIGARAVVEAGGTRLSQTVYAAQGFMCAPSRRLHFGLSQARKAERIEVHWPGGATETFADVPADARYRIVQGKASIERVSPRTHPALASRASEPVHVEPRDVTRIVLYERLPAGALELPAFAKLAENAETERRVADLQGRPFLVWVGLASDAASRYTLQALASQKKALDAIGAPLIALEAGDPAGEAEARELFEKLGVGVLAGRADKRFLRALEVYLVEILGPFERLADPVTLLFDRVGQLTVVYSGVPRVEEVLADVAAARDLDPATRTTEPLLHGRWAQPLSRNLEGVAQIFDVLGDAEIARYYHGLARARSGR